MLDEVKRPLDQPRGQFLDFPGGDEVDESSSFDLRKIIGLLRRRWKFILGVAAFCFLAGFVHLARQTPVYTANVQILLDPRGGANKFIEAGQNSYGYEDLAFVEDQIAVITSAALLRRVVERERLLTDPEFGAPPPSSKAPSASPFNVLAWLSGSTNDKSANGAGRSDGAAKKVEASALPPGTVASVGALQGALVVKRVGQANLLNIAFTSVDPAKAARLANAIAEAYAVDQLDARLEAATRATSWFNDRLVELRNQLRQSEEAIAKFRADNNLVQSAAAATLSQEQVGQLNMRLVAAQAETAEKKAHYDVLKKIESQGGDLAQLNEVMSSSAVSDLRKQAADISRQAAELLSRYSEKHPSVVNLRAQLQDLRRQIGAEIQRIAAKIGDDYQLAKARQEAAEKALQEATGQVGLDAAKAITLRELERTAAVNKTLFEDYLQRSRTTKEQSTFQERNSRVITPAEPPAGPSAPKKGQTLAMALALGLLCGAGGAYLLELLAAGFTTAQEVEQKLGLPVLASISHLDTRDLLIDGASVEIPIFVKLKPLSRFAESLRMLRSGVQMSDVDRPPKVVQITSTMPGEGKTTIALAVAVSAAQGGAKVLFIDADLRHPSASRTLSLEDQKGLVDYLTGEISLKDSLRFQEKSGVWAMPAGGKTQNPSDLLQSERMKKLIDGAREQFDLIVIDTPPHGPVVDPTIVAGHLADVVVFVVRWASTPRDAVQRAVRHLARHVKIAGVVFNHVDEVQAKKYGGYGDALYYAHGAYGKYYRE